MLRRRCSLLSFAALLFCGGRALADEGAAIPPGADTPRKESPARPPLPEVPLAGRLPWQRHGDIGVGLAWVSRPFAQALGETRTRYQPAIGAAAHLQWDVASWLHVRPYFLWSAHAVDVRPGALATGGSRSIRADATLEPIRATTFAFGMKIAPQWQPTARLRTWIVAGVGYGRLGIASTSGTESDGTTFNLPERTGVFVEFPMGLGGSFEIWPGRAAITFEATGAPLMGHSGSAHETMSFVDGSGKQREAGAFGAIEASFVQSLGLSLLL